MKTNVVYNEDCLRTMDFMPSECIDLIVTSPPYGKIRAKQYVSEFDFTRLGINAFRILKDSGVLVWVVGDQCVKGSESGESFRQALYFMQCGFKLHDTMIYQKLNFIPQTQKRYEQAFEYMFVFVKGQIKTFNPQLVKSKLAGTAQNLKRKGYGFKEGSFRRREEIVTVKELKVPGNIFSYGCGNSGKKHSAVFPLQLAVDHVLSWSNENDTVYDPFSGSGTTLEAAKLHRRQYIGSEISKEYCEIIKQRLITL